MYSAYPRLFFAYFVQMYHIRNDLTGKVEWSIIASLIRKYPRFLSESELILTHDADNC